MPPAKLARVGYSGVTCSAVWFTSTGELHERISAPMRSYETSSERDSVLDIADIAAAW